MLKSVRLKLLKIKYSGDSVGNDIRAEIEIINRFLRVDKTIKVGATAEINREIGRFETDRELFETNARITVIEKDFLFNDVGGIDEKIKIDTNIARQQFIYKVRVKENRSVSGKVFGKSTAIFEIILEVSVLDAIRYVPDEEDGWLVVLFEDDKSTVSLPAYLKVRIDHTDTKREYFTILEGAYRGKLASVRLKKDRTSRFILDVQHGTSIFASYSISKKVFTLNGKIYTAVDYKNAPWKKGLYDIEIPDYPHGRNNTYTEAKRQKIWFRIGHDGERYLHAGSFSLGCITITETVRWMEIYNALIRARKGDDESVGVLEVVD